MRVLLTGASGFVGRQIAKALLMRGIAVRATTRGKTSLLAAISDVVNTPDLFSETPEFWARALDDVDTVIHAAWYVEHGAYVTSPLNLAALAGTLRLAEAVIAAGTPRFVGLGTCFEYDLRSAMPLASSAPLAPATPYGAAKAATWMALSPAFAHAGVSFVWTRLFYLYGEGEDRRRFVPSILESVRAGKPAEMTSGTQIRDYMEVAEAGRQIVDIALGNTIGAVNVCSGRRQSLADLARELAAPYGGEDLLRLGALPDRPDEPPEISGVPYRSEIGVAV